MHTLRIHATRNFLFSCKETVRLKSINGNISKCLAPLCTSSVKFEKNGRKGRKGAKNLQNFDNSLNNRKKDWPDKIRSKPAAPLFKPVIVLPNPDDIDLGEEIAGKINKQELLKRLNDFSKDEDIKALSKEHGLDDYLYNQAYTSFRKFCMEVQLLPPELYVLFSDILAGASHIHDIFPYFLTHARKVFPHLECLDDLKLVSDLTDPPNWYPDARNIQRKIIFHAGPTNSGKTYHALERFMSAESGVYCSPLKLLAVEVANKCNARGTPCDLVTGEERKYANEDEEPSNHVACTVEMTNCSQVYEVAVIDEIQMVKDYQRGWAWTRALLGIPAHEVHVCGEAAAIDLVREMMLSTGDEMDVRTYKRLTNLVKDNVAVERIENVQPGDCIVCFNKKDIYSVSRGLEKLGVECAVIYGSLPPGTKLGMAAKFNDPSDPCKVLVATDAVGMGLNLNIRRIIFYSLTKLQIKDDGEKVMEVISVSQALQIAGRAGRYNTQWETGHVTCFRQEEIPLMHELLSKTPEDILQAGLHPTYDQIETYAYHLPHATMANLVDIFISLSTVDDSLYNLCQFDDFKFIADMIEHIKLPLKAKYTLCCAPLNRRMPFVCTMFLKITRQFSRGELITFDWICHQVGWPFSPPDTILDLIHLEAVHDVFDLYLWLSYRFQDMFPDVEIVRSVQSELDSVIEDGVANIVQLLKNADSGVTSGAARVPDEDAFEAKTRKLKDHKRWKHEDKRIVKQKINDNSDEQEVKSVKLSERLKSKSKDQYLHAQTKSVTSTLNERNQAKLTNELLQEWIGDSNT